MGDKAEEKIQELSEILQADCNETATEIMKISKCSPQDAINVWIFRQLAILQLKVMYFENLNNQKLL